MPEQECVIEVYQLKARTSDKSQAVAKSEMNTMMFTAVSILFSILILLMSVQPLNMENLNDLFCSVVKA